MGILSDCHTHTMLCGHASGMPTDYVEAAQRLGLDEVTITDHAPAPSGYDNRHRMRIEDFPLYAEEVAAARSTAQISVLFGIEADYYDGCEDFQKDWLAEQDFDLVIGSVHYIETWGFDSPENRAAWDAVDVSQVWKDYFKLIEKLAETRMYDLVAHFDLPKKFGYRPEESEILDAATPALVAISHSDMAIEINTSGLRKKVAEIYPSLPLLRLARQYDIPIAFGSDAHQPDEVAYAFDAARRLAREAGYDSYVRYRKREPSVLPIRE